MILTSLTVAHRTQPPFRRWPQVALRDVCEPNTGFRDPTNAPESYFQYVDITSVDSVRKRIVSARRIIGRDAPSRARQIIRAGDVIVATTRPNLNAVAIVPPELDNQICSTGFCVLRPRSDVLDTNFLFSFVRSDFFVRSLSEIVKGALYPAVTAKQVFARSIPLPDLDEQRRIGSILVGQMATVAQILAALDCQKKELELLSVRLLEESLSREDRISLSLSHCLMQVCKGVGHSWHSYPVLGATRAGLAPAKESVGKRPERYKLVDQGTIFYNPMRILLGSIAMIDVEDAPGITSPDYVVFKCDPKILDYRWFYCWLRSPFGEWFIKGLTRGAVRERLLFKRLAAASVELPSIEAQRRVAERLPLIREGIRKVDEQLGLISALPAAFLRRAFSGSI